MSIRDDPSLPSWESSDYRKLLAATRPLGLRHDGGCIPKKRGSATRNHDNERCKQVKRRTLSASLVLGAALIVAVLAVGTAFAADSTSFRMVRSSAAVAADCLNPKAHANVTINSLGPVEVMNVTLRHMPKNKEFDLFVIQQPDKPFGVSWYQGDIETNKQGEGHGHFVGRFSKETFSVAPGVLDAPVVHEDPPFPDASENPQFAPVHQFHLGLWFGSADAAKAAGCPDDVTPFNGDHTAGIQALSTRNFPNLRGPLRKIK